MKFFFVSMLTIIGVILFTAGLNRMMSRREAPAFVATPVEHREPFRIDISLPTLSGETLRLAELRGQVVLLNIWATWCYPCRAEMPAMAALYRRYRPDHHHQGFTIVAVANDPQGREVVEPFVRDHNLPFPVLLDVKNALVPCQN